MQEKTSEFKIDKKKKWDVYLFSLGNDSQIKIFWKLQDELSLTNQCLECDCWYLLVQACCLGSCQLFH